MAETRLKCRRWHMDERNGHLRNFLLPEAHPGEDTFMSRRAFRLLSLLFVALFVASLGGSASAAKTTPPGDPPGNNGTIKVKKSDPATDPNEKNNANQPHIDGCILWLSYSGFDKDQTADITFTAHPPSGTGQVILAQQSVAVSPDAAGGGKDQDVVISYNLSKALQGLKEQKNQGYHIKVTSDTKEAPGGAKQKVFWIKCTAAAPTTLRISKATQGGPVPTGFGFKLECNHHPLDKTFTLDAGKSLDVSNVPQGTTCAVTEIDKKGASGTTAAEDPPDSIPNDGVVKVGDKPVVVVFTNAFPGQGPPTPAPTNDDLHPPAGTPAGGGGTAGNGGTAGSGGNPGTEVSGTNASKNNPGTSVLGATETAPNATLPRTGHDPRPLTATGLWSLGLGGMALLAGRRLRRS